MASSDSLRRLLLTQLDATAARRPAADILQDVPPDARGIQPEGLPVEYSLWQILEHMRVSQWEYFNYCIDPDHVVPDFPDDYWPASVAPPSEAAWDKSLDQFFDDLEAVRSFVRDPDRDLRAPIPHASEERHHTADYAEEIAAIAEHNTYHLGQFVAVRRLVGAWPPAGLDDDA
jgi:uncharacterized damage-inducible protein DinB